MSYRHRRRVDWDEEIRKTERIRRRGLFTSLLSFAVAAAVLIGVNRTGGVDSIAQVIRVEHARLRRAQSAPQVIRRFDLAVAAALKFVLDRDVFKPGGCDRILRELSATADHRPRREKREFGIVRAPDRASREIGNESVVGAILLRPRGVAERIADRQSADCADRFFTAQRVVSR